ncbi:MAG: hypothetical protein CPSOU_3117 [uncultured Paraburkholderia sp.]|nr:MAG: hypothetical protein CPSOU_3117 [uncultured Paraburkholderia sp.]
MAEQPAECVKLQDYFAARHPQGEVWLTGFKGVSSGYSNETRFFTLNIREGGRTTTRDLVVRWAPVGANAQFADYDISY